jgi:hypothetical protein
MEDEESEICDAIEKDQITFESPEELIKCVYRTYNFEKIEDQLYRLWDKSQTFLLYVRSTKKDIEIYIEEIAKRSFGPERISENDFFTIQQKLTEYKCERCIYVIHSEKTKRTEIVEEILFDKFFLEWKTSQM